MTIRPAHAGGTRPKRGTAPPGGAQPSPEPPIPPGARRYVRDIRNARPEPSPLHGLLFARYPTGRYRVLKFNGESTPDVPPSGTPDIPAELVRNNRVVMTVNGIGQELGHHLRDIGRFLQAGSKRDHGADVGQPVVGVHEGVSRHKSLEVTRIGANIGYLKLVQSGALPLRWLQKRIYRIDAAVKTAHDEIRQSLQAGRDVQLVVHSGGGTEAALALNLLAREDGGLYRQDIARRVRVLALASASSRRDFEMAGVRPENIYSTGSDRDPVAVFGRTFIDPGLFCGAVPGVVAMAHTWLRHGPNPTHSLDYMFAANARPDGSQPIQEFLDGGPGGDHPLR